MKNNCYNAALISAAEKGNTHLVNLLLAEGAEIDTQDEFGCTALIRASIGGYTEIIELLITKLANVDAKDNFGCTALIRASGGRGHTETVNLLLAKGADVNATDNNGNTALMNASSLGHKKDIVKLLLLAKGVDVNATSNDGNTALILADRYGKQEVSSLLRACGAGNTDPKKKDWTNIMWAASNNYNLCRSLIIAGYYVTYSLRGRFGILDEYISWREAVCNIALKNKALPAEVLSAISEHLGHKDILALAKAKIASVADLTKISK